VEDGVVADVAGQGAVLQLDQQVAPVLAEQTVLFEAAPELPVRGEPEPVVVALRLRVAPPALQGVQVGAADRPEAQGHLGYLEAVVASPRAAWPAARRAVGTRNGEQDT
jgi:hypothetical protein